MIKRSNLNFISSVASVDFVTEKSDFDFTNPPPWDLDCGQRTFTQNVFQLEVELPSSS